MVVTDEELSLYSPPIPEAYERWNEALADEFFPPRHSGPVYLDPNDAALRDLAASLNIEADLAAAAFVEACKETLVFNVGLPFLYRHDQWFGRWVSSQSDETPPMVALL